MTPFGWLQIVRLGLAQTALGAIVVLTTSTLNRVMAVELALPALLPGLLVALHHVVQLARPRWGFGSDRGGRRTPWIVGGMAVLAIGGAGAAGATAVMATHATLGAGLGVLAFTAIGVGVGAAGTNILVLLAQNVGEGRRAAAATIVWVMMIAGFVVTGGTAGHFLDPFSLTRLVAVCATVSALAFLLAVAATWRLEPPFASPRWGEVDAASAAAGEGDQCSPERAETPHPALRADLSPLGRGEEHCPVLAHDATFSTALATVWADATARRFTVFVFASMLAYSMQDLILEPFAGLVFGMTPGATTKLAGLQNAGTLAGMIGVALLSGTFGEAPGGLLKRWITLGCLASAASLGAIALGGLAGAGFPIQAAVFALGLANGAFAAAAIGSMMGLAGQGDPGTRGTRMGLWGAAQAIGFGFGGLTGAALADLARGAIGADAPAYAAVFALEAAIFVVCAVMALRLGDSAGDEARRCNSPLPSRVRVRVRRPLPDIALARASSFFRKRPLIRPPLRFGHLLPRGEKGSPAPSMSSNSAATP